ncbi:Hypothetical protein A7982_05091 [Minicystis rosea]|nr:Hypothetical protein A7982_05091 [Minicystis rosea]
MTAPVPAGDRHRPRCCCRSRNGTTSPHVPLRGLSRRRTTSVNA